jgi:hypothetical protein
VIERKRHGRRLLIASIGVAAVSYVACGGDDMTQVANLMAPAGNAGVGNPGGSANQGGSANSGGASNAGGSSGSSNTGGGGGNIQDAASEKAIVGFDVLVANLIAPPPPDAKDDNK